MCAIAWPAGIEAACGTEGPPFDLSAEVRAKTEIAYNAIGLAVAAYEASPEVNAFASKYDLSFKGMAS